MRKPMLKPFKCEFSAPNGVALYLFEDGSWVIENFTDQPANVTLSGRAISVAARGWAKEWK